MGRSVIALQVSYLHLFANTWLVGPCCRLMSIASTGIGVIGEPLWNCLCSLNQNQYSLSVASQTPRPMFFQRCQSMCSEVLAKVESERQQQDNLKPCRLVVCHRISHEGLHSVSPCIYKCNRQAWPPPQVMSNRALHCLPTASLLCRWASS